jgi:hypothetical protein
MLSMEFQMPSLFSGIGAVPIGETRTERIGNVERKTTRLC